MATVKPKALTNNFVVALINAARRAGTTAGWRSAQPFLALTPSLVQEIDGDEDQEFIPVEYVADDAELLTA